MSFLIGPEKKFTKKKTATRLYYPSLNTSNIATSTVWVAGCLHKSNRLIKSESLESNKKTKSPYESSQKSKYRPLKRLLRPSTLDNLLIISRNEIEASILIQSAWRRIQAIQKLHQLGQQRLAAVLIQAVIRGSAKRRWYKRWIQEVILFATKCQSRRRQILASKTWKHQCFVEKDAAITIQNMIRKFNSKCWTYNARKIKCASKIQSVWREYRLNHVSFMALLDRIATKIQCQVRRVRAERTVSEMRMEKTTVCLIIQKSWRGFLARRKSHQILLDRNNDLYRRQVLVITAELEHLKKSLEFVVFQEQSKETQNELNKWNAQIDESRKIIDTSEKNLRELVMTKNQITPDFVSQGWDEEIQSRISSERRSITSTKLDLIFNLSYNYEMLSGRYERSQFKKSYLEQKIAQLEDEKRNLITIVQSEKREIAKRLDSKSKRMAIADEKRKWKVVRRYPNGKPAKCQPGFDWKSKQDYSFCSGSVNLFPENVPSNFDSIVEKVELQSYLSEIDLLNNLSSNPLSRFISR